MSSRPDQKPDPKSEPPHGYDYPLIGGSGDDILYGGDGKDTLTGGARIFLAGISECQPHTNI